jgi:very-short-patch-repair endonuclease
MQGYKLRRQVPIGRYIADFVCHEARLIVEIDGGQHDRSSPQEARAKWLPAKRRLLHSAVLEQRGPSAQIHSTDSLSP